MHTNLILWILSPPTYKVKLEHKGGSWAAATSKMECFETIVNGWKPLTIITKSSILDVAAALDPPLEQFANLRQAQLFKWHASRGFVNI